MSCCCAAAHDGVLWLTSIIIRLREHLAKMLGLEQAFLKPDQIRRLHDQKKSILWLLLFLFSCHTIALHISRQGSA